MSLVSVIRYCYGFCVEILVNSRYIKKIFVTSFCKFLFLNLMLLHIDLLFSISCDYVWIYNWQRYQASRQAL